MPKVFYPTHIEAEKAADDYFNKNDFSSALEIYTYLNVLSPNNLTYEQKLRFTKEALSCTKKLAEYKEEDSINQTLKGAALAVYTPPFKYEYGYIYDSTGKTVADNSLGRDEEVSSFDGNLLLRVRGWGHIQKIKGEYAPDVIQDEIGRLIAVALTRYWTIPREGKSL